MLDAECTTETATLAREEHHEGPNLARTLNGLVLLTVALWLADMLLG